MSLSLSPGLTILPYWQSTGDASRPLWALLGADMNTTADQLFSKIGNFTTFSIEKLVVSNASVSMTTAVGGVYGAPGKADPELVTDAQVYSALINPVKILNPILVTAGTDMLTIDAVYLSLGTPQGTAATADFWVMGYTYD